MREGYIQTWYPTLQFVHESYDDQTLPELNQLGHEIICIMSTVTTTIFE